MTLKRSRASFDANFVNQVQRAKLSFSSENKNKTPVVVIISFGVNFENLRTLRCDEYLKLALLLALIFSRTQKHLISAVQRNIITVFTKTGVLLEKQYSIQVKISRCPLSGPPVPVFFTVLITLSPFIALTAQNT